VKTTYISTRVYEDLIGEKVQTYADLVIDRFDKEIQRMSLQEITGGALRGEFRDWLNGQLDEWLTKAQKRAESR